MKSETCCPDHRCPYVKVINQDVCLAKWLLDHTVGCSLFDLIPINENVVELVFSNGFVLPVFDLHLRHSGNDYPLSPEPEKSLTRLAGLFLHDAEYVTGPSGDQLPEIPDHFLLSFIQSSRASTLSFLVYIWGRVDRQSIVSLIEDETFDPYIPE